MPAPHHTPEGHEMILFLVAFAVGIVYQAVRAYQRHKARASR